MFENLTIPGTNLEGPHKQIGDKVERIFVFLHGYGADGNDLIGLSDHLSLGFSNILFVSPHAPSPCDMVPMGRQWFPLAQLDPARLASGAKSAMPALNGYIEALLSHYQVPASKLMLMGFSQGAMMSLFTAYRRDEALAGVVALSGGLPGAGLLAKEVKSKPPATLVHGIADPVVPVAMMSEAAEALISAGVEVQTHAIPGLEHNIDNKALNSTYGMMRRCFLEV